jgi:hypothetical protein
MRRILTTEGGRINTETFYRRYPAVQDEERVESQ